MVPYLVGPPLHMKYALCIVELVPKSMVEVVPWEAYEENPSLHPQRESYCCHKKS